MSIDTAIDTVSSIEENGQPYPYRQVELVEPDWTRFPGWRDVTAEEWRSAQWQRAHCVKNVKQQIKDLEKSLRGREKEAQRLRREAEED